MRISWGGSLASLSGFILYKVDPEVSLASTRDITRLCCGIAIALSSGLELGLLTKCDRAL